MNAKIIDGKKQAEKILAQVKKEVNELKLEGTVPKLAVILVGDNPASQVYVSKKEEACKEAGIEFERFDVDENISQEGLTGLIQQINDDKEVNGLIVQLPLPNGLSEKHIIQAISPKKDVDGFTLKNFGKLFVGKEELVPATPKGVIKLIESTGAKLKGAKACVVGTGMIAGKPLALMLINRNATVTTCDIFTKNLKEHTSRADILCVAVGKPGLIKKDMVKKDAIVIDIGTTKVAGKLKGDVAEEVKEIASFITPVPGGVGPMTVACLLENVIIATKKQQE